VGLQATRWQQMAVEAEDSLEAEVICLPMEAPAEDGSEAEVISWPQTMEVVAADFWLLMVAVMEVSLQQMAVMVAVMVAVTGRRYHCKECSLDHFDM
jgi:hypothetical protein